MSNLALNDDNEALIAAPGAVHSLVKLLRGGNDYLKESAAGALRNLSVNEDNRVTDHAIPSLMALLRSGNNAQVEKAVRILYNLSGAKTTALPS